MHITEISYSQTISTACKSETFTAKAVVSASVDAIATYKDLKKFVQQAVDVHRNQRPDHQADHPNDTNGH